MFYSNPPRRASPQFADHHEPQAPLVTADPSLRPAGSAPRLPLSAPPPASGCAEPAAAPVLFPGGSAREPPRSPRPRRETRWSSRFESGGGEGSASRCEPQPRLERDVPVLALRALDALGLQGAERADQLGPGLVRFDHVVDVAALGRRVGVGEVGLVVVDQLGAAL